MKIQAKHKAKCSLVSHIMPSLYYYYSLSTQVRSARPKTGTKTTTLTQTKKNKGIRDRAKNKPSQTPKNGKPNPSQGKP